MTISSYPSYAELLEVAVEAARVGADSLRQHFRRADLEITEKSRHDFVTHADHESERRILEVIQGHFPEHTVLAEESGFTDGEEEQFTWIIDPLDGTSNFLQGLPNFCISIACRQGREVVAGVVFEPLGEQLFCGTLGGGATWNGKKMSVSRRPGLEGAFLATGYPFRARAALDLYLDVFRDVFLASRGIRRCGAAALDLAYTAAGVYDGFFEFRLSPWDVAAGTLLIQEAGGSVTDLDGTFGFMESGNLVAGPPDLQRELLGLMQQHVSEARLDALEPRE